MGMELMARYSLPAADRAGSAHGADVLKRRGPADRVEVLVARVVDIEGNEPDGRPGVPQHDPAPKPLIFKDAGH
jgi:hypothetical protein